MTPEQAAIYASADRLTDACLQHAILIGQDVTWITQEQRVKLANDQYKAGMRDILDRFNARHPA